MAPADFIAFLPNPPGSKEIPSHFGNPFNNTPHPLGIYAAHLLQQKLPAQNWKHNFGLDSNLTEPVIGKMFGVLVVWTPDNELGYLSAFSGKIGNQTHYPGFVPPVFDTLDPEGFLERGMQQLTELNQQIAAIQSENDPNTIDQLKEKRKKKSNYLSDQLYDQYELLNQSGETKSIRKLFPGNPPGGAGECAAPKLLQFAFQHKLQPLSLAEFYWGKSTTLWQHKQFYPPCEQKCRPILSHMLEGL